MGGRKVIVVLPAYNAAKTLRQICKDIPQRIVNKVILVDDASQDETVTIARELNLEVLVHHENRGYGGNQKTCYAAALGEGADYVVMLHPDGQYDPKIIAELIESLQNRKADLVLGSRMLIKGDALRGGMPLYKYLANRVLSAIENLVLGLELSEFHTGYRAYTRNFLQTIPFLRNSDDFVFDTEILVEAVAFDFRIEEIPVQTRYFKEASSVNLAVSLRYGVKTLFTVLKYVLHRSGVIKCKLFIP